MSEPHGDGVADCDALRQSVAVPLLLAHCEAEILALPLGVAVWQTLALIEGVNDTLPVMVRDPLADRVADSDVVGDSVIVPLPLAHCVEVMLPLPLALAVWLTLALIEGQEETLPVIERDPLGDKVADCDALRQSVAVPLLLADCEAEMLALPLGVAVEQTLRLEHAVGEIVPLSVKVGEPLVEKVEVDDALLHSDARMLLLTHCVVVTLAQLLEVAVAQSLTLTLALPDSVEQALYDVSSECEMEGEPLAEELPERENTVAEDIGDML